MSQFVPAGMIGFGVVGHAYGEFASAGYLGDGQAEGVVGEAGVEGAGLGEGGEFGYCFCAGWMAG